MVGVVYAFKAWSIVFTGNSGVSRISVIFFILGCMWLTLDISVISTIFVTLVLLWVASRWVFISFLILAGVGYTEAVLFLFTTFSTSFNYFKCYIVSPSINSLINSFFFFNAIYLRFGVSAVWSSPFFGIWWVIEWSWMNCLGVNLWSYAIASFLIIDLTFFWGFIFISWVNM